MDSQQGSKLSRTGAVRVVADGAVIAITAVIAATMTMSGSTSESDRDQTVVELASSTAVTGSASRRSAVLGAAAGVGPLGGLPPHGRWEGRPGPWESVTSRGHASLPQRLDVVNRTSGVPARNPTNYRVVLRGGLSFRTTDMDRLYRRVVGWSDPAAVRHDFRPATQTPTPTGTATDKIATPGAPVGAFTLADTGEGFFAVLDSGQVWRRDTDGGISSARRRTAPAWCSPPTGSSCGPTTRSPAMAA